MNSLNTPDYGYGPDIEIFPTHTTLMRRCEGYLPNRMAASRFVESGRLKNYGKNGMLAYKKADIEAWLSEQRTSTVNAILSKGPAEAQRVEAQLAEANAAVNWRATASKQDCEKAKAQVVGLMQGRAAGRESMTYGRLVSRMSARCQMRLY